MKPSYDAIFFFSLATLAIVIIVFVIGGADIQHFIPAGFFIFCMGVTVLIEDLNGNFTKNRREKNSRRRLEFGGIFVIKWFRTMGIMLGIIGLFQFFTSVTVSQKSEKFKGIFVSLVMIGLTSVLLRFCSPPETENDEAPQIDNQQNKFENNNDEDPNDPLGYYKE